MPNTIRVLPNPFVAYDRYGTPCGVCPLDPEGEGASNLVGYVGATVSQRETTVLDTLHPADNLRSPRQHTVYEYLGISATDPDLAVKLLKQEPIELPASRYYRARVGEGSIVCVDEESARFARRPFVPPRVLFEPFLPKPAEPPVEAASESAAAASESSRAEDAPASVSTSPAEVEQEAQAPSGKKSPKR